CGFVGLAWLLEASYLAYLSLHALQHRGEEAAGIVSSDGEASFRAVAQGLVDEGFGPETLAKLRGDFAIGHARYSTAGGSIERNCQPLMAYNTPLGEIALAHNGNIPGFEALRSVLQRQGALFYTESDTEILLVAIVRELQRLGDKKLMNAELFAEVLKKTLTPIEGTYSLVILSRQFLALVRDPWGVRPLALGRLGDAIVGASETSAFDLIGAGMTEEVKPGEIVVVERGSLGLTRAKIEPRQTKGQAPAGAIPCIFELVYFARPNSSVLGRDVYQAREAMGRRLAEEAPAQADCVIAVPDSASVQALGYAQRLGLPYELGLVRSHYIGRTFIAPTQTVRDFAAKLKYSPVRSLLAGKRVVVVDDSVVRGTTSKKIIRLIREQGGAREVHLRVASPPVAWPCFYGIDMPTKKELVASGRSVEEIRDFLGVETLNYLSLDGMLGACSGVKENFCHACFSGEYRIAKDVIRAVISKEEKKATV
ncbi:MAG: amidophosphoribosyltransferase, partial [Elusimicrobiota bacterium]